MGNIIQRSTLPLDETPASHAMGADERKAFRASVERGLAQIDAGEVVPGHEVDAWLDSWFTENELPMPLPVSAPEPK